MSMKNDTCVRCAEIDALPWSPTKRDMALEHIMKRVCQGRSVEAHYSHDPCPLPHEHDNGTLLTCVGTKRPAEAPKRMMRQPGLTGTHEESPDCRGVCDPVEPEPAKPPESETLKEDNPLAFTEALLYRADKLNMPVTLPDLVRLKGMIINRAEADAQCLKEATERAEKAERERDVLGNSVASYDESWHLLRDHADKLEADLAAVKGRLAGLITKVRRRNQWLRDRNMPVMSDLEDACAEAEAGEQGNDLGTFLNLPYVEQKLVFTHRRELVQTIKDYAGQHTQYPFANAIIDLCNQVLEPARKQGA